MLSSEAVRRSHLTSMPTAPKARAARLRFSWRRTSPLLRLRRARVVSVPSTAGRRLRAEGSRHPAAAAGSTAAGPTDFVGAEARPGSCGSKISGSAARPEPARARGHPGRPLARCRRSSRRRRHPISWSLLNDREARVRRRVQRSRVGRVGLPEAVEPLIQALDDEEPEVRQMAAFALGLIGDRRPPGRRCCKRSRDAAVVLRAAPPRRWA